jgi:glycosyltransferase involved in cell wall biosynthesis
MISIVTPSFNQAKYLPFCLNSVRTQRLVGDIEHLVMDGGSTDGSLKIIKHFSDQLDYWDSKADNGQSAAINAGFARARGDIFCWINSDDGLMDGAINIMRESIGNFRDPAWGIGRCVIIDESGIKVDEWTPTRHNNLDYILCWSKNYIMQPAVFWNRKLWEESGILEEKLHYAMDFDLWLRFFQITKPILVDDFIGIHRIHRDSKTSLVGQRIHDEYIWALDNRLSLYPNLRRSGRRDVCESLCQRANLNLFNKNYNEAVTAILKASSISLINTLCLYFRTAARRINRI